MEVSDFFANKMKKTLMKASEEIFADNLSWLLFENCVRIGYFIHSGIFMCFTQLFTGTQVFEDFKFCISGSRNNQKCTALIVIINALGT